MNKCKILVEQIQLMAAYGGKRAVQGTINHGRIFLHWCFGVFSVPLLIVTSYCKGTIHPKMK